MDTIFPKVHRGLNRPRRGLWEIKESARGPVGGFLDMNYISQKYYETLKARR